ncbi:FliM/FliN family flagellar motor switch protein [Oxalobacteraceae bacterium]|nr:FliM/FliN family flagellar motor switch protein [Oxalobacteraceae bacterium]
MEARPYVLTSTAVLSCVQRALDGAIDNWCADWGVARSEIELDCLRAWEGAAELPPQPAWREQRRGGAQALWLAWPGDCVAQLQRALFGTERHHGTVAHGAAPLAEAGAAAAWQGLIDAVGGVALPGTLAETDATPPPAAQWQRGSGAVLLVLRLGRQLCHGVLSEAAVAALAQQARLRGNLAEPVAPALAPCNLARLLAPVAVRLPIEIGRAQVGLGSLMGLGVGDVIRLDSPADRPFPVTGPTGAPLFGAYLGLSGTDMALEVAPLEN